MYVAPPPRRGVASGGLLALLMTHGTNNSFASQEDEPVVEMTAAQLGLRVQADEVVRVIKQYVEDVEQEKRDAGAAPAAAEEMSQAALVRERTRRDEKQFWKNMSRVVPERTFRVWAALEGGLVKYNKLLKERSGVIDEVRHTAPTVINIAPDHQYRARQDDDCGHTHRQAEQ